MTFIVADRVKESTSTTGTGSLALGGAPTGFRSFASVCGVGDTIHYCIAAGSQWEVGLGTYSAADTLARTTVLASSTGSKVDFSAGSKDVFCDAPASWLAKENILVNGAAVSSGTTGAISMGLGVKPSTPIAGTIQMFADYIFDNLIPLMTSASTPTGAVISASSNYYSTPPWWAAARGTQDGWITDGSALPQWWKCLFPKLRVVSEIGLTPWSKDTFPARSPTAFTVEGSTNGTDGWVTVATLSIASGNWIANTETLFPFSNTTGYLAYRILISANGGDTYTGLKSIRMLGYDDGIAYKMLDNLGNIVTILTTGGTLVEQVTKWGTATNYSEFEADGTLKMTGAATVWEDLRFPATAVNPTGAPNPMSFDSDNVGFLASQNGTQCIAVVAQMPHSWKAGSDIEAHIHWGPTTTGAGNVVWLLEYRWVNIEANDASGWTEMSHLVVAVDGAAYKHQMDSFGTISGAGKNISSIITFRLSRLGGDAADTYGSPAILKEFDLHYEQDTIGSRTMTTK